MRNTTVTKLIFAGLFFAAGAAQAGAPSSVSEVPGAWYADRIQTPVHTGGATTTAFPTAAYEHGPVDATRVIVSRPLTRPSVAGSTSPFPSSPNETGAVL